MSDPKQRFRSLDRIPAPDLWRDISRREPAEIKLGPSWRRIAVAGLALLVAATGIGLATWAFVGNGNQQRTVRPAPITRKSNGKIAFIGGVKSVSDGQGDGIYVVNPDGSGLEKIGSRGMELAWSPDGSRLAYVIPGGSSDWELHVVDALGNNDNLLVKDELSIRSPSWSPDGRRIAISMGSRSVSSQVYVLNADGSGLHPITEVANGATYPAWSPDGTQFLFVSGPSGYPGSTSLFVVGAGGSAVQRLTKPSLAFELNPRWSPDGTRVAFIRNAPSAGGPPSTTSIVVMRVNATEEREVYSCTGCGPGVDRVAWSPDGSKLLFSRSQRSLSRLWVMDVDGRNRHRVDTGRVQACCADWQPVPIADASPSTQGSVTNGEIWFQRGGGEGGVWIESVQPDGSDVRVLLTDTYAGGSDDVGSTYNWTGDGARLAFIDSSGERIKDAPTGVSWDVFTMNADGSERQQITHDGSFDAAPSWSPAGDRIVYASDLSDPDRPACQEKVTCTRDIFVINADGSGWVQLTSDPGNDWQPDWSPDGSAIVFIRDGGDIFAGDIYSMSADGTNVTPLTDTAEGESHPRWSPDGTQIAFVRGSGNAFSLYVMAEDGSNARLLASGLEGSHSVEPDLFQDFSWSPDGASIAFAAGGTLSVVDVQTGSVTKLVEDKEYGISSPAWRPIPG